VENGAFSSGASWSLWINCNHLQILINRAKLTMPLYGLFGLGMALYFASQGAGRLLWPLLANLTRLAIATGGGWLALRWSGDLSHVFLALGAALAAFELINAGAVARGAWFGPIGWPRPRAAGRYRR